LQAFILAAGKGTRLLPYTQFLPKPLFPVLGIPLIELILKQLLSAGITRIGINLFHLKEKLKKFLLAFQRAHPELELCLFEEKELLGTGGAFLNARSFFRETTLVINADILTNFPLKLAFQYHQASGSEVTMLLVKEKGGVRLEENGKIFAFRNPFLKHGEKAFSYVGIQVLEPEVLNYFFYHQDLIKIYEALIKKGITIKGIPLKGFYFKDIGTIKNYLQAHEDLLLNRCKVPFLPEPSSSKLVLSQISGFQLEDWVFVGRKVQAKGKGVLRKTVVWDNTTISSGTYENTILTPFL